MLVAFVAADKIYCPPGSKGDYPKCICAENYPYDEVNNICSVKINVNEVCPKGTTN